MRDNTSHRRLVSGGKRLGVFFWLAVAGVLITALYGVRDILAPFLIGMAVAYFLDPLADILEGVGLPRGWAAAFTLAPFFLIVLVSLTMLAPVLQEQLVGFVAGFPAYAEAAVQFLTSWVSRLQDQLGGDAAKILGAKAGDYTGDVFAWLGRALGGLWGGGLALFNLLSLLVITPIVAFYFLRDWDLLVARFDALLPRDKVVVIRTQLSLIDRSLSGFLRGAGLVCLCLATFYATVLSLLGLQFGLLIGLVSGLLSFIPYVGALLGFLTGVAVAVVQFQEWMPVLWVAAVFMVGQIGEGYILTPRLIGDRIGLHPLWLLFSLMAGGVLMGFVGLLLAIPVAASLGVLCRFFTGWYLQSPYYQGEKRPRRRSKAKQ